jgi:hypothetical protein
MVSIFHGFLDLNRGCSLDADSGLPNVQIGHSE